MIVEATIRRCPDCKAAVCHYQAACQTCQGSGLVAVVPYPAHWPDPALHTTRLHHVICLKVDLAD